MSEMEMIMMGKSKQKGIKRGRWRLNRERRRNKMQEKEKASLRTDAVGYK